MQIDEAERHALDFEHQQVAAVIARGTLEPARVLGETDFVLGVHVAAHVLVVAPGEDSFEIPMGHPAQPSPGQFRRAQFSAPDVE